MPTELSAFDALCEDSHEHLDASNFEIEMDNGVLAETFISIDEHMITVAGRVWLDACETLDEYEEKLSEVQARDQPEKEQFVNETYSNQGLSASLDVSETGKFILLHGEQVLTDGNGDDVLRPERADVYQCYYTSDEMKSVADVEQFLETISGVDNCSINMS